MKFSAVTREERARPLEIVLPGADKPIKVRVRAIGALEEQAAEAFAIKDATAKGVVNPARGHNIFDVALWAHVVASAFLDADSASMEAWVAAGNEAGTFVKDAPFFDGGVAQVLPLPSESIAYLYQEQQRWQEEVSPSFQTKNAAELVAAIHATASASGDAFFMRLSPSYQLSLARFMAGLLVISPDTSWRNTSPTPESMTTP